MKAQVPVRTVWRRSVETFFFSNYFLGVLAVALSVETNLQLSLPLNSGYWYLVVFSAVVLYYTYAYVRASDTGASNPRTKWYATHSIPVGISQAFLTILLICAIAAFVARYGLQPERVPVAVWWLVALTIGAAAAYYGKLPFFDPRRKGWTKAATIGWCWAVTVSIMPLVVLQTEMGHLDLSYRLAGWLFLKNWMFCNINAILFDIKDYADDSNRQLKTFVVRYGIRYTILSIILPMTLLGIGAFLCFAYYRGFTFTKMLINLIPFLLTLFVAFSLHKKRSILYYLIVIDGMLLIKALCGISAVRFAM
ncbi:hypothetical protein GCM10023091_15250 [Ravibacter arvi]|uniref:UbiA prenyltransferase family protein n=1 Tax=Ravibacter arvi TaxID=2051041 RepID=A0ABP8LUA6_9BACT